MSGRGFFGAPALLPSLLVSALLIEAPVHAGIEGTYRNLSFNVDGAGGSQRFMAPLVICGNGSYTWSQEAGSWSGSGAISFSGRPTWGAAADNGDGTLAFHFFKDGKEYYVTMYRAGDATGCSGGGATGEESMGESDDWSDAMAALAILGAMSRVAEKNEETDQPPKSPTVMSVTPAANAPTELGRIRSIRMPGGSRSVAALPDGSLVASDKDGSLHRFDSSGKETAKITSGDAQPATHLSATGDGSQIMAMNTASREITVINSSENRVAGFVKLGGTPRRFSTVYDDGAIVSHTKGVAFINSRTKEVVAEVACHDAAAGGQGRYVYVLRAPEAAGGNPIVSIVKSGTSDEHARFEVILGGEFSDASIVPSPDESRLYVLVDGERLVVWDVPGSRRIASLALPAGATRGQEMALSGDGTMLAVWSTNASRKTAKEGDSAPRYPIDRFLPRATAFILNTETLAPVEIDFEGIASPVAVSFSPDSRYVYVSDAKAGVFVYRR